MRRASLGFAICGGAVLVGMLQFAGADTRTRTDSRTDATPNSADIISATAGHRGKSRLVHTVKFDGAISTTDPNLQIVLQINTEGDLDCEREIIWPPKGSTHIVHCGQGPIAKLAAISRPTPRTMRFVFKKGAIDSPARYGWRVITRNGAPGGADLDYLPDQKGGKPVYIRHKLR
jgi:hypothetical protein